MERNDNGRFTSGVDVEEILAFVREEGGASAAEISEEFDVSSSTARRKCRTLVERGDLREKHAGIGLFWLPKE